MRKQEQETPIPNPLLKAGFTMIEILVTFGVIALLAALAIVPMHQVRIKAHNAAIKADIAQMRVIAEDVFDDNDGAGYCGPLKCAETDPRMAPFMADVNDRNGNEGGDPEIFAEDTFCVSAFLRDGTKYCADSSGAFTGPSVGTGVGECVSEPWLCQ